MLESLGRRGSGDAAIDVRRVVPALFDYIHPCNKHRSNKKSTRSAGRNKQDQLSGGNQRERIHRPDGTVIVVIGISKLWTVVLFLRVRDTVEMRMHRRRMIAIGPGMNVLKRRHKECQQQRKAVL